MSTADVLAVVLFLFFAVGIAVGIVMVIAWSARRPDKTARRGRPDKTARRHRPPAAPGPSSGYFDDDEPGDETGEEPPWWHTRDGD